MGISCDEPDIIAQIDDLLLPVQASCSPDFTIEIHREADGCFDLGYSFSREGGRLAFRSPDMNCSCDFAQAKAVVEIPASLDTRSHFKGKPFRTLWSLLSEAFGVSFLHCAVVEKNGRGLALIGQSGSGKSTLAIELARNGWNLIGDDFVPMTETHGVVSAYPFFRSVSMFGDSIGHSPFQVDHERRKNIYRIKDLAKTVVAGDAAVRVDSMFVIGNRELCPQIEACSTTELLRGMLATSFSMDALRERSLVTRLAGITRLVSTWRFIPGMDLSANEEAVRNWWALHEG